MNVLNNIIRDQKMKFFIFCALFTITLFDANVAYASNLTIGGIASQVTKSFEDLAKLITASSYLAGLGFSIGAILKFKQHKDNPTQIPVGTPVAMLFIASALLFLPSVLGVTGRTIFGAAEGSAKVAGPRGTVFLGGNN